MADTVEGVGRILDGEHDDPSAEAFAYVGTIAQVREKAKRL